MSAPPALRPRTSGPTAQLLRQPALLHDLVDALGSPLNVVLPEGVTENHAAFRDVLDRHHLTGHVYYAHKANRSTAFVRQLAATDARIDVASLGELQAALGAGFAPDRVMVTGPKTDALLWLAVHAGVTVNVDSVAEATAVARLVKSGRLAPARVLTRLSGFETSGARVLSRTSRFGIPASDLTYLVDVLDLHRDELALHGVSYHLDTISLQEKAIAFDGCLRALDHLRGAGHRPRVVDIGGGFGVSYLEDGADWDDWTSELSSAVRGTRPPMTWDGYGYGLRHENGAVRGALSLYPAYRPVAGAAYLDELLTTTGPTLGRPLATALLENLYDLWVEPGRALVDQCGVALGSVTEVRRGPDGHWQVVLALNARDVSLEEHGVVVDPVLVPRPSGHDGEPVDQQRGAGDAAPVGVYLLGNLCLEADLLTRRLVRLPRLPRPGDLLGFVNTAGYFMDFSADSALQQPVARKVAARHDGRRWRWWLDDEYWPTTDGKAPQ